MPGTDRFRCTERFGGVHLRLPSGSRDCHPWALGESGPAGTNSKTCFRKGTFLERWWGGVYGSSGLENFNVCVFMHVENQCAYNLTYLGALLKSPSLAHCVKHSFCTWIAHVRVKNRWRPRWTFKIKPGLLPAVMVTFPKTRIQNVDVASCSVFMLRIDRKRSIQPGNCISCCLSFPLSLASGWNNANSMCN